jgi:hypothetical protein
VKNGKGKIRNNGRGINRKRRRMGRRSKITIRKRR